MFSFFRAGKVPYLDYIPETRLPGLGILGSVNYAFWSSAYSLYFRWTFSFHMPLVCLSLHLKLTVSVTSASFAVQLHFSVFSVPLASLTIQVFCGKNRACTVSQEHYQYCFIEQSVNWTVALGSCLSCPIRESKLFGWIYFLQAQLWGRVKVIPVSSFQMTVDKLLLLHHHGSILNTVRWSWK